MRLAAWERGGGAYERRATAATAVHAGWSASKSNGVLHDIALLLLDAASQQPPIRLPNGEGRCCVGGDAAVAWALAAAARAHGWPPASRRQPAASACPDRAAALPSQPHRAAATLALEALWGTNLTALGWGDWGEPGLPPALRQVALPLHNASTCAAFYPEWPQVWNASLALCAGGGPGKVNATEGTCGSDAGGPLLLPGSRCERRSGAACPADGAAVERCSHDRTAPAALQPTALQPPSHPAQPRRRPAARRLLVQRVHGVRGAGHGRQGALRLHQHCCVCGVDRGRHPGALLLCPWMPPLCACVLSL